jgi:hypothetical protein
MRGVVLAPQELRTATLVERGTKGDKWSSHVTCGKHSTWESVTCGSPLARGLAATLELVLMGTRLVATK